MGPLKSDHWMVYHYDDIGHGVPTPYPQAALEIMMHDMPAEKLHQFYQSGDHGGDVKVLTRTSGIEGLLPGSKIDDFLFDPCGYSMNGLRDEVCFVLLSSRIFICLCTWQGYWTIHVTPESHCSYVSFETTIRMDSYTDLIRNVLRTFAPRRFTVTVLADEPALPTGATSTLHTFEKSLPGSVRSSCLLCLAFLFFVATDTNCYVAPSMTLMARTISPCATTSRKVLLDLLLESLLSPHDTTFFI